MSQTQNKINWKKMNYLQPIQQNTTHFFQYFLHYLLFSLISFESMTGFCIMIKELRKCYFVSAQD